jgi:SAM-dependent methyltransferase
LVGADIDSEAIAWCNRSMSDVAKFVVNPAMPPAPFEDGFFDLIYSVSVFTHLPEDMELAWIAEMARLLAPQGILVASLHGDNDFDAVGSASARDEFNRTGFCYLRSSGTAGLPDFYHGSFHKPSYVGRQWGQHFNMLDYEPRGINHHQDACVCEKRQS